MKLVMALTYKAIFYHSLTGNTKAIVENSNTSGFDVYNMIKMNVEEINFDPYEVILIGASTYGDGVPHEFFKRLANKFIKLENKKIGLFGSGNSIYPHYCGALDLIADLLKDKNEIKFIFRFESYPTKEAQETFQKLIDNM
jgi:flavodoxin I